jgi:hypothetical protein
VEGKAKQDETTENNKQSKTKQDENSQKGIKEKNLRHKRTAK